VLPLKHIDPIKLVALARAAELDDITSVQDELFGPALVAPPEHEGSLHAVPDRLVDALARLDSAAVGALGRRWSELQRADIASIPDASTRASELAIWTDEVFCEVSAQLAALCRLRAPGERLYLAISF